MSDEDAEKLADGSLEKLPSGTAEIKTVPVDEYIKGVMLACVGNASFGDGKYKEGFKALGVAAYT